MGSARYTWQKAIASARKVVGDDDAQVRTYLESLIQRGEEQKATRKESTNG
jgi:ABC-type sulfate transport system substrate-binding protein